MLTLDGDLARIEGNNGRVVEIEAMGVYRMRIGKPLPDGRMAWLDLGGGELRGENMARALLTRHKLEAAVYAARYWKDRALRYRRSGWGMNVLSAGILYLIGKGGDK